MVQVERKNYIAEEGDKQRRNPPRSINRSMLLQLFSQFQSIIIKIKGHMTNKRFKQNNN